MDSDQCISLWGPGGAVGAHACPSTFIYLYLPLSTFHPCPLGLHCVGHFLACPCWNAQKNDSALGSMTLALQGSKKGCMSRDLRIGSVGSCSPWPRTKKHPIIRDWTFLVKIHRNSGKLEAIPENSSTFKKMQENPRNSIKSKNGRKSKTFKKSKKMREIEEIQGNREMEEIRENPINSRKSKNVKERPGNRGIKKTTKSRT